MTRYLAIFFFTPLLAVQPPITKYPFGEEAAWFTGPLLAESSLIISRGHCNIEPYLFATANTAVYNSNWDAEKIQPTLWNFILEPLLEFGLTEKIDFYAIPAFYFNRSGGTGSWSVGDLTLGFNFQLYRDKFIANDWYPNVRLAIHEIFPMGKYDGLDPYKNRTQVGGGGSYATQLQLNLGKLTHISSYYYLTTRLQLSYLLPAPVKVHGFSIYGGGYNTNATIYPPQVFNVDFAFEISLSRNWAFAMDLVGQWSGRLRSKGNQGTQLDGSPAILTAGRGVQFSLAPALEYNWNSQIGLIFGSWFTVAGKNSVQFTSTVIAFNYYK